MPDAPDLAAARLALDTAIAQLIQPGEIHVDRDTTDHPDVAEQEREHQAADARLRQQHADARARRDHAGMRRALARLIALEQQRRARRTDRGWTPSLLDQLRDAVESTSGGGGAAAGPHRAPIGLAAAELLGQIESIVGHSRRRTTPLVDDVRAWAARAGHWQTEAPNLLLVNAHLAQQWAANAYTLLNPARRLTAAGACPNCGRAIAHIRDDTGETVRRPALELDPTAGSARCIASGCGAVWPPDRIQLLAAVLEEQAARRASA